MKKIYLDYAASTPVDPAVEAAMKPFWGKAFGNPSSLYSFGQEAAAAVFKAKNTIAQAIGANYRDIIFTGSATEANNLFLRGVIKEFRIKNLEFRANRPDKKSPSSKSHLLNPRILVSSIEHESVLETARDLEKEGVEVIYLPVSKEGIVDLKKLKTALNERTVLVSIMHANNEIGTIQPISEIVEILKAFRRENLEFSKKNTPKSYILNPITYPLFHTDAVQSFQYLDCNVKELGVDFMTLSAHKIYGPKGIGVLYARATPISQNPLNSKSYILRPIITGGGQQDGIRPGTESPALAVGFAKAVELAVKNRERENRRVRALRDYFWKQLKKKLPKTAVNGSMTHRLPNNLNIYFPGYTAQDLLIKLDLAGVAVSAGAACTAHVAQSSYVLEALGWPLKRSSGSLRFTLGRQTTKMNIDKVLDVIKRVV